MSNFESVTIANEKMDKSIAALKREFASLRAGRALSLIHISPECALVEE